MPTEVITAAAATGDALLRAAGAYAISTGINILFIRRLLRGCRIKVNAFPCLSVTVSRKDERREAGRKSLLDAMRNAADLAIEDEESEDGDDKDAEAEAEAGKDADA